MLHTSFQHDKKYQHQIMLQNKEISHYTIKKNFYTSYDKIYEALVFKFIQKTIENSDLHFIIKSEKNPNKEKHNLNARNDVEEILKTYIGRCQIATKEESEEFGKNPNQSALEFLLSRHRYEIEREMEKFARFYIDSIIEKGTNMNIRELNNIEFVEDFF